MTVLRRLWPALALCLWSVAALAQTAPGERRAGMIELDAEAMRRLAYQVLAAGDPVTALGYVEALLARDPGDAQALILRSQAQRSLGQTGEARKAARTAWVQADTERAKFGAAMVMAQALSTAGRRTGAQFWLRRAAQVAPTATAEDQARRDWRHVRSRNPWTFRFDLSVSPSSNVNGGSKQSRMQFYGFEVGLSGDAQALSGGEVSTGFSARYALPSKGRSQTDLSFSAMSREVWLSDAAKLQAPQARAASYAFAAVEAAVRHTRSLKTRPYRFGLGMTAGHNWYGGRDMSDYMRLQADVERSFGKRAGVQASLMGERQWRRDNPVRSADVAVLTLGGAYVLGNKDKLSLVLTGRATRSAAAEIESDAVSARLGWDKAAPLWGMTIGMGLSLGVKEFARSNYVRGGREDQSLGLDLSVGFEKIDYMGFSPTLDLRANRNRSNVALYDSRDVGVMLGFRSNF